MQCPSNASLAATAVWTSEIHETVSNLIYMQLDEMNLKSISQMDNWSIILSTIMITNNSQTFKEMHGTDRECVWRINIASCWAFAR